MKPDLRNAPLELWRIASRYLNDLFNLFGPPEEIAARRVFAKDAYDLLSRWLRAGECLLRELLLLEASLLGAPASGPAANAKTKTARAQPRAPKLRAFHSANPEDWRVSFKVFVAPACNRQEKKPAPHRRAKRLSRGHYGAWGIARRCEALLRVYNNPGPYAARLARRLFAAPQRIASVRKIPAAAPDLVGRESFAAVRAAVSLAATRFDSS